jgi:hypothetical protein
VCIYTSIYNKEKRRREVHVAGKSISKARSAYTLHQDAAQYYYEFHFVQSSAAGYLSADNPSAGPLFSISLHQQTESKFHSVHFSLWGTGGQIQ